jgi:hypothetical protein
MWGIDDLFLACAISDREWTRGTRKSTILLATAPDIVLYNTVTWLSGEQNIPEDPVQVERMTRDRARQWLMIPHGRSDARLPMAMWRASTRR